MPLGRGTGASRKPLAPNRSRKADRRPVERSRRNRSLQSLCRINNGWVVESQWFDTDQLRSNPAGQYSPEGPVIGPPGHRLPCPIATVWIGFRPDAVTPGLSEREIASDDLRRPQAQPHQLGGIIEIKDAQIVRQLVGSERSLRAGQLRKVQHRWFPAREVAESLAARGFGQTRQVPNVIVRVVDAAAALGTMLIQRMPWLAGSSGGQVREDAVGQHSGGTDPGFGVEGFQHRRRT